MASKDWMQSKLRDAVDSHGKAEKLYEMLEALRMTEVPSLWAPDETAEAPGTRAPVQAHGVLPRRVVILGAGIGGLTTAHLLQLAGYHVTVLEAQPQAGGRSKTARPGDTVSEVREGKAETQTCRFDAGLYINLGPGRIPYHHRRVLNLCKETKVDLEVYVMSSDANLYRDREIFAHPQPRRRIATDAQGYISELLAKAIQKNALEEELAAKGITDKKGREDLMDLLKNFGSLSEKYTYEGSSRAGCAVDPSVSEGCQPEDKNSLRALVNSEFWDHKFYQSLEYEWQDTLFQPVGGMDKIWKAFLAVIEQTNAQVGQGRVDILYNCPVTGIRLDPAGVTVTHALGETTADYCVSNIPLSLLANKVQANFSDEFKDAVDTCEFAPTCKVGWQADARFWESDANQIYGGVSYVSAPGPSITQMWYPSNDYFGDKGTLTGCYNYDDDARELGRLSPAERVDVAWAQGKDVHPEFEKSVPKTKGITIAWQNVPHQEGGWADWDDTKESHHAAFTRLLMPDAVKGGLPVFSVVGDQVSSLPGWQEGAMMSAEHVVHQILGLRKMRLDKAVAVKAPNTRRLIQGR